MQRFTPGAKAGSLLAASWGVGNSKAIAHERISARAGLPAMQGQASFRMAAAAQSAQARGASLFRSEKIRTAPCKTLPISKLQIIGNNVLRPHNRDASRAARMRGLCGVLRGLRVSNGKAKAAILGLGQFRYLVFIEF
jgi:hypothetical protein